MKHSSRGGVDDDEDEEDEDDDDSYEGLEPNDAVPTNVDIEVNDDEKNLLGQDLVVEKKKPLKLLPAGVPTAALNPRNYAFVPSQWTERIRGAGRPTIPSESVGNLLCQRNPRQAWAEEDEVPEGASQSDYLNTRFNKLWLAYICYNSTKFKMVETNPEDKGSQSKSKMWTFVKVEVQVLAILEELKTIDRTYFAKDRLKVLRVKIDEAVALLD